MYTICWSFLVFYVVSIYFSHSNCTNLLDSFGISIFFPPSNEGQKTREKKVQTCTKIVDVILWCSSNFSLHSLRYFCLLAVRSFLQFNLLAWHTHTFRHTYIQFAFNIFTTIDCIKSLRYYLHLCVWLWQVLDFIYLPLFVRSRFVL